MLIINIFIIFIIVIIICIYIYICCLYDIMDWSWRRASGSWTVPLNDYY